MHSVAVTGVAGPIGQRLVGLLEAAGVERIVGIDPRPSQVRTRVLELIPADVATVDLKPVLTGVDAVVHLAWEVSPPRPLQMSHVNLDAVHRVLDAVAGAGVGSFVYLSSAMVYGAWADNPVPLTEQAPLRPNPGIVDPVQHAEAERLIAEWSDEHPAVRVAVLRAVPVLGPGVDTWLARALGGGAPVRAGDTDPPRQFVHVDDVASAVALATSGELRGAYNLTPDGWIAGEVARDLLAGWPPLPVPSRLTAPMARLAWAAHLTAVPPALLPFVEHPWIVANDRLRAAGWEPRYSNEEALVAGSPGSRWREMSPRRRQEVALGAAGATLLGIGALVAALVVRRARRRRPVA